MAPPKLIACAVAVAAALGAAALAGAGQAGSRAMRTVDTGLCPFQLEVTASSAGQGDAVGTTALKYSFPGPTAFKLRNGSTGRTVTLPLSRADDRRHEDRQRRVRRPRGVGLGGRESGSVPRDRRAREAQGALLRRLGPGARLCGRSRARSSPPSPPSTRPVGHQGTVGASFLRAQPHGVLRA